MSAALNRAQREVIAHYQALNVPATWFTGAERDDGGVEVIALGGDADSGFVWSFLIAADGTYTSSEAPVGPFSTGIEV